MLGQNSIPYFLEWCNNKTSHTSLNLLPFCEEKNTSNKDIFSWQLGKMIESV